MTKSTLLPILLIFLSLNSIGQPIKAQWADNLRASKPPGSAPINSLNYYSVMCSDGGFYATFSFIDTLQINNITYTANGKQELMIVKYSSSKQVQWIYTFHAYKKSAIFHRVFLGEDNSIYVGMRYDSAISLGSDTTIYSVALGNDKRNSIVLKLNKSGKMEWVNNFETIFITLCKSYADGCFVADVAYGTKWKGVVYQGGTQLHFNSHGKMDYTMDSLCQNDYPDIMNDRDSNAYIRGYYDSDIPGAYARIGSDTLKFKNQGDIGFYACVEKKGHKTKWIYTIKHKNSHVSATQEGKMVLDKFGNSYFVDMFSGDSVQIENKLYKFQSNGWSMGLLQLDKNGKFKKFIADSFPNTNEHQYLHISLSSDSTKLILVTTSDLDFWFPGMGNYTSYCNMFVLDILQDLKCIKHYDLHFNTMLNLHRVYSPNPWDYTSYAVSQSISSVNTLYVDTLSVFNTNGNNVAIIYFSDKKTNVGIQNAIQKEQFVFPNPCLNYLHLNGFSENDFIDIFNSDGKWIKQVLIGEDKILDVSNLPSGVYFLKTTESRFLKLLKL